MHEPRPIKRATRIDTNAPGVLIDSEGRATTVVVADLSAGGCRIISDAMPIIGEHVRLRVGRIADYPAQVRWALGNEAGLEFSGPSDPVEI
ncbi:PilZ domain-containing protein [Sphingomonas sp. HDW15A]|uniref:PilZ domain-containing protein n=1 Tax=Sphingomonas sp. HDW15A TaxID=2714942 RepID=UPI0014083A9D|nr:PilZ domain-containing protein [Sphingomonas sp. HDW15A]QIK96317.1 PilZ domain-containing protein [Sphingomonas sp. HDW15A]